MKKLSDMVTGGIYEYYRTDNDEVVYRGSSEKSLNVLPDYDEDEKTCEYKKYRNFYDSNQIITEVTEDKSYLKWYENWKKENFNYKEKEK